MTKDNIFKLITIEDIPVDLAKIPGLDSLQIDYVSSIGGSEAPEPGATDNSAEIVNGILISAIANAQFNTSTKEILDAFTFGASGALKMITDANNGLWISPTGILGKKAGVTTFAVDTGGNASFRGSVVITGGSGIANLSDAGALALLSSIGASNVDTTIISGGKIITGLLTADNIQAGILTGLLIRTSASANTGIKISSSIGGMDVYGETITIYDTSGTKYGTIGSGGAYFNISSFLNRNILMNVGTGTVFVTGSAIAPSSSGGASSGLSSQYWSDVFTNNLTLASGRYFNVASSKIVSNSDFRVVGSIYLTGNLIFENAASVTIGARVYYETTGAYDASKYYLRTA